LRVKSDAFVRESGSKAAPIRTDPDEFMLVIVVMPITSLTMPVAVMMMMPIIIIPVVISTVLVGKRCPNYRPLPRQEPELTFSFESGVAR